MREAAPVPRTRTQAIRFRYDPVNGGVRLEPEQGFYAVPQVAAMLGVTRRSVERWIEAGLLASIKPGQARLVEAASLRRLLAASYMPARGDDEQAAG